MEKNILKMQNNVEDSLGALTTLSTVIFSYGMSSDRRETKAGTALTIVAEASDITRETRTKEKNNHSTHRVLTS
jgi:hypothetical protein